MMTVKSMNVFKFFDILIFGVILKDHTENDLEKIRLSAEDVSDKKRHRAFIFEIMNALDSKTAALLTHISLLVAVLSFYYTFKNPTGFLKFIILTEITSYLILTLFCLRSIRMTSGLSDVSKDETKSLQIELYKRRSTYDFAASATIIVTLIMIGTLIIGSLL